MDAGTYEKQLSGLILPSKEGEENRSGLDLGAQSDKDRLEELKEIGKKEETAKQFETMSQPAANVPPLSSNNVQGKMQSARQELENQNWSQARRMYNDILDAEPENAEANLGLFMAEHWIPGKKHIPEAARDAVKDNRDIFLNLQFVRARRYADDSMREEIRNYERGRDYLIAIEKFQRAKTIEDYQEVSAMFARLGDFADARKQKEECDGYWQKPLYDSAVQKIKSAKSFYEFMMIAEKFEKLGDYEDARDQRKLAAYLGAICSLQDAKESKSESDFSTAIRIFKELGDYSDSKEKIKECEEGIEQLKGQWELYEKYKQEYEKFDKQVEELQEIKRHESKIGSQRARIDSLKKKRARSPLQKRWIFIIGGLGLLCYFIPAVFQWLTNNSQECWNIYYYIVDVGILSGTLELIKALMNMIALVIFGIIAFIISCIVAGFFDEFIGYICFFGVMLGLVFGIPILTAIDIFVYTHDYRKQVHLFATVALAIAIAMIVVRVVGKARERNLPNVKAAKIKQLEQCIDDEYEQIKKFIGLEYQKIYDRYPIVGSRRKEVSVVQKQLMERIKKNN